MFNDSPLLRDFAALVHEQARNDCQAELFRVMIREAAEDSIGRSRRDGMLFENYLDLNDTGWRSGTDSVSQFHKKKANESPGGVMELPDLPIAPNSATPLNQMYATLAAIHDVACPCKFRLCPWPHAKAREVATEEELIVVVFAVWYTKLKNEVCSLTNEHRPGLERALDAVVADLEKHCGGQGGGISNTGNRTEIIMGDKYENVQGSTVVSRSDIKGSFNQTRDDHSTKGATGGVWKWLRTVAWSGVKKRFGW